MAPAGAPRHPLTPGLNPKAWITRLCSFFLVLTVLPFTSGLPARSEKLISPDDLYYWLERQNDRIQCELCPAGTFVKEPCTVQYSKGKCERCPGGEYSEHKSGMPECISCTTCHTDQEEVSPCTASKNTVCQCKKGTFCSAGQSCEICSRCTTSCPEGQVVKLPCNATSDLQCTTPGSSTTNTRDIIIGVVVTAVLLIIIIIIIVGLCRKRRNNDTGTKLFGKISGHICNGNEDCQDADDPLLSTELQFNEDMDPKEIVSKSFVIIAQVTPVKYFQSLMLRLGLPTNEVDRAVADNVGNINNQHIAMLHSLNQLNKFNINALLRGLKSLGLRTAAQEIANQLTSERLYVQQALQ